jgi:hypothetical protein
MSETSELNYQADTFRPWLQKHSPIGIAPSPRGLKKNLPLKDSLFACGFLTMYLAVYLAAGFAGITAIGWVWTTIFG